MRVSSIVYNIILRRRSSQHVEGGNQAPHMWAIRLYFHTTAEQRDKGQTIGIFATGKPVSLV